MLPQFPQFKHLELSDKVAIEAITSKYPPYSDFNFTSMWSWDVKGEMQISQLNGNLVVRFNDYATGDPFYSFLGDSEVDDTARKLLELSTKEGLEPVLKLLPEISAVKMDKKSFVIGEDRDQFDYIYTIDDLINYQGSGLKTERNLLAAFLRRNKNVRITLLDLKSNDNKKAILALNNLWGINKGVDIPFEKKALEKFFSICDYNAYIAFGVFIDDKLIAFSINEKSTGTVFTNCFFANADTTYCGISAFLMNTSSKILKSFGFKYINYEQDLGINGLRKAKEAFKNTNFLRKYQALLSVGRPKLLTKLNFFHRFSMWGS